MPNNKELGAKLKSLTKRLDSLDLEKLEGKDLHNATFELYRVQMDLDDLRKRLWRNGQDAEDRKMA